MCYLIRHSTHSVRRAIGEAIAIDDFPGSGVGIAGALEALHFFCLLHIVVRHDMAVVHDHDAVVASGRRTAPLEDVVATSRGIGLGAGGRTAPLEDVVATSRGIGHLNYMNI